MSKAADILTVEVGSTFTKLIFYRCDGGRLTLGGRASGLTTIGCGDVSLGYRQLLSRLDSTYGVSRFGEIYLSSSAAGGLRVVVCGLTRNLTTKAALESALGAGGIVLESITGLISKRQAAQLAEMNPGMILLCGGLDGGEEATLLQNAAIVAELPVDATIVYAGNQAIREEVREILVSKNKKVVLSESNVYPRVDEFRFREVQDIIRRAFEINVVKAPGIEAIQRETRPPIPTPLAVSYATELLGQEIGDMIVFDVGGATTDVHSYVGDGRRQDRVQATIEPPMKRSVEGDLGVFYNLENLMEAKERFAPGSPTDERIDLARYAQRACRKAILRHCGERVAVHSGTRLVDVVYGRDLSAVKTVIGTGGAIIYGYPGGHGFEATLQGLPDGKLVPLAVENYLVDRQYLMSSLGLMARDHAQEVRAMLLEKLV